MRKQILLLGLGLLAQNLLQAQAPCASGSLNLQTSSISCAGQSDGGLQAVISGGSGNYSYSWSTGATTASLNNLPQGVYSLTVTDTPSATGSAPTVLYNENFNGTHNWQLNVASGPNGADNNFWVVNDNEGGTALGNCGLAGGGDQTLHITSQLFPTAGAAYNATGFCGVLFCTQTNMRAESPTISTLGFSNVTVTFDYIANGQGTADVASFVFNDGSGWQTHTAVLRSTTCASGQGLWTNFVAVLPASAANIANLRIGINWTNNEDNIGTDPSVAINNVQVIGGTTPPPCTYTASATLTAPSAVTVNVTNIQRPNCDFGNSQGSINVIVGGGVGGYRFNWSNGATTQNLSNLSSGLYGLTVSDNNNCSAVAAADLRIQRPILQVTAIDERLCPGQADGFVTVATSGLLPGTAVTYLWSNGETTQSLSNLGLGTYTLTASVANGTLTCSSTLSATMREPDSLRAFVNVLSPLGCSANSLGVLEGSISGGWGNYNYLWSNGSTSIRAEDLGPGTYSLTVTDEEGCSVTANSTPLTAPSLPQLNAWIGEPGQNQAEIIRGQSINLNAGANEAGVAYAWTGDFLQNLIGPSTSVEAGQEGEYLYVVQATLGPCSLRDTVRLTVVPKTEFLGLPTAFTPNGDGQNDRFRPIELEPEYIRDFRIFNRWGQIVYNDARLNNGGWDGTLNGQIQPRDVYIFVLEYQLPGQAQAQVLRGEVTLIR